MDDDEVAKLCAHLDEFALPRAVVDSSGKRFVGWNETFLKRTGFTEEELRDLEPEQIISESESAFSPADASENPDVKFYPVAVRAAKEVAAVPGYLVKSSGDFGYLMLEELDPNVSTTFEQGRLVGKEQQRARIAQMFHEEISSNLLAAIFKIHLVKQKLEASASPDAQQVAEASEILSEAIDKMVDALGVQDKSRGSDAQGAF
jgi:signal transduction histidine kinase